MSLTIGERPVHFPANPDNFGFDAEVSRIFPDMARRAIPNFYESHIAHARMLRRVMDPGVDRHAILDVGASRGAFLTAFIDEFGGPDVVADNFRLTAIDNSIEMCGYLANDFPMAHVIQGDIAGEDFMDSDDKFDVVCCHYVLQFVRPEMQGKVLQKLISMVKPGGVFIFGHKALHAMDELGNAAHEEYIEFRIANGYTREEIEAKTKALKGSMFPVRHDMLMREVKDRFRMVQETFRFMMFSTFMAVK
jgi:tRNA (cmo5U34)-methyltransferase